MVDDFSAQIDSTQPPPAGTVNVGVVCVVCTTDSARSANAEMGAEAIPRYASRASVLLTIDGVVSVTDVPASAAVATLLQTWLVSVPAVRVSTRLHPAPEGAEGVAAEVDSARTSASPSTTFEGTDTDIWLLLTTLWFSPMKLSVEAASDTETERVAVSVRSPLSVTVSCTEYVPAEAYGCEGAACVEVAPSPNFHAYDLIEPSGSDDPVPEKSHANSVQVTPIVATGGWLTAAAAPAYRNRPADNQLTASISGPLTLTLVPPTGALPFQLMRDSALSLRVV